MRILIDHSMKITILGAGTSIPSVGHSPAAILMQTNETSALIDIGPGTIQRGSQLGLDYFSLETIFLTHLHSDHTLDLVTFLQANDSTPGRVRTKPIHIIGCLGTQNWFDTLMRAFPGILPAQCSITISEKGIAQWNWQGLRVSTMMTGHTSTSIAYKFENNEGVFVYTGDAVFSERLADFCKNADLLVAEGSFPSGWKTEDHLNADTLGVLAQRAGAKHLVVTHRYPPAYKHNLTREIKKSFSARITLAKDGLTLVVPEKE